MTRGLVQLVLSSPAACRALQRSGDIAAGLRSSSHLIAALRAARLTGAEIDRLVQPLAGLPELTETEIAGAVETVLMQVKYG
ncbi:hypothetical protein OE699_12840 [Sedimentimonas flavescens]|uniref:Uncharacterized protein n=1 Tax=Sedimentimonas flavescens TaxID=2851012 RepID=A0ABT3A166_9RHOB|nr:hypothetical protein [Sedimentimonas flavescens]MCV2879734.1 hypothetical protein [Sedimentimonas flavescens]